MKEFRTIWWVSYAVLSIVGTALRRSGGSEFLGWYEVEQ